MKNGVPAQDAKMVFLRRMLLTCKMVMNFVMRGRCIDVDSETLRVVFKV